MGANENPKTRNRADGRKDVFWGGQGKADGKNHGHKVYAPGGFPLYSRQPGPKKKMQKSSYSLLDDIFGIKPPKRR